MKTAVACVVFVLGCAAPAAAHHSAGLVYATDQQVSIEGVVTRFELGNPHMRIYFTRAAPDAGGAEWMAEGGSRTVLARRGWTGDTLKRGDRIVLHGNPSRDASPKMHVVRLTMPDGSELFAEDLDRAQFQELRERRRPAPQE